MPESYDDAYLLIYTVGHLKNIVKCMWMKLKYLSQYLLSYQIV